MNIRKRFRFIEELILTEDYDQAERQLAELFVTDYQNPEVHYLMGEVLCKKRIFKQSIKELEIANTLLPHNPRILHLWGWAVFMSGDDDNGKELMKMALKKLPNDADILRDLAAAEIRGLNFRRAIKYIKKALKLDPDDPLSQEVYLMASKYGRVWDKYKNRIN